MSPATAMPRGRVAPQVEKTGEKTTTSRPGAKAALDAFEGDEKSWIIQWPLACTLRRVRWRLTFMPNAFLEGLASSRTPGRPIEDMEGSAKLSRTPKPDPNAPALLKRLMDRYSQVQLATLVDKAPEGHEWVHEIKFDGYRLQVHLRDAVVKVFTRRGNDWTNRFRKIASDAWHVNAGSAIIDGEIVVPAADGTTDFSVLQNELRGKSTKIVMVAFDLL